jgi:hypothetical protein
MVEKAIGKHYDTEDRHPAYAMIGASRVSCGPTGQRLFGSDFAHTGYISVKIAVGSVQRSVSKDWYHAGRQYIEVALSEAQWATFVSTLNIGDGVPCTLEYKDGQRIPGIAETPNRKEQFKAELEKEFQRGRERIVALVETIKASKLSQKQKDEICLDLNVLLQHFGDNHGFVAKQFGKHVETTLEHAKIEISAYVTGIIARAGLKALAGDDAPPIVLLDETS